MVTAREVRKLALALPETEEKSHFDTADFRVRNKIFATIHPGGKQGVLKLAPEAQQHLLAAQPDAFAPAAGAWGARGWTLVTFARVKGPQLSSLLREAWRNVAPKSLLDRTETPPKKKASAPKKTAGKRKSKARAKDDAWSGKNRLTLRPGQLAKLREICLSLPDATEKEAWGDPTWRVRNKVFAMQKGNYEGGRPSLWVKAAAGAQEAVVSSDPERYFVPPYVGSKGWIGIHLDGRVRWSAVEDLVRASHRLVSGRSPR